jgi:hypothetical protein
MLGAMIIHYAEQQNRRRASLHFANEANVVRMRPPSFPALLLMTRRRDDLVLLPPHKALKKRHRTPGPRPKTSLQKAARSA